MTCDASSNTSAPPGIPATSRKRGIGLACLLGLLLMILSFVRLAGDMNSAAFSFTIVEAALTEPVWKTRLGFNIALFFTTMLALHLALGLAVWILAAAAGQAFPRMRCTRQQWVLVWFLSGALWLLVANATYFPRSSLGAPYHTLASTPIFGASPLSIVTALLSAAIVAVVAIAIRGSLSRTRISSLAAGVVVLVLLVSLDLKATAVSRSKIEQLPHVVLLGIDSLRPDLVTPESAPHLHSFMKGAVHLTDAVTPLARTFPAWVSILSGRHPHTTGATMNLLPPEQIRTGATLPELLRRQGYRSYYAIDETRFSNIDESYGFDRTAIPSIGASDFLISWFGDTPLSNLVVNTRLGAVLFPHLHANRAAHVVYDPDSLVRRVGRSFDFSKPSFLAIHLTLPHWPYTWAASLATDVDQTNTEALYRQSVARADRQFGDLLTMLQERGVLDNALVVALSDHGEALGHEVDFLADAFPGGHDEINTFQRWGHGTSVFSPSQYRVVLGIRAYGRADSKLHQPAQLDAPVSLLDLAPTILELVQLKGTEPFDGVSLVSLLRAHPDAGRSFADRIRFTETEYNPQGFTPTRMERDKLALAAKVYRLDPVSDRILVRTEYMPAIMANRQYAALLGARTLATAIPGERGYRFIYIPDIHEGTVGNGADAERLRLALQTRFSIRYESGVGPVPLAAEMPDAPADDSSNDALKQDAGPGHLQVHGRASDTSG